MKTPYGVKTHNSAFSSSSWIADAAVVKCDPIMPSATVVDQASKCGANSTTFIGVSNENKDQYLPFGVDESEYFVGKVGTAGVTLGDYVKTDGAGGFILGETAGDNQVAIAMAAGSAGDYIEFRRLPVVKTVPAS